VKKCLKNWNANDAANNTEWRQFLRIEGNITVLIALKNARIVERRFQCQIGLDKQAALQVRSSVLLPVHYGILADHGLAQENVMNVSGRNRKHWKRISNQITSSWDLIPPCEESPKSEANFMWPATQRYAGCGLLEQLLRPDLQKRASGLQLPPKIFSILAYK